MDPLLGQINLWPVPWVPQGFALCDGTILNITQNAALFSLIGTNYGGDGVTTFKLPDFKSRVPMGSTSMNAVGIISGSPTATTNANGVAVLQLANLPAHSHTLSGATVSIAIPVNSAGGTTNTDTPGPTAVLTKGTVQSGPVNTTTKQYSTTAANTTLLPFNANLSGANTGTTGSATPTPVQIAVPVTVSTLQPSLSVNFIIAVTGIYPSRP